MNFLKGIVKGLLTHKKQRYEFLWGEKKDPLNFIFSSLETFPNWKLSKINFLVTGIWQAGRGEKLLFLAITPKWWTQHYTSKKLYKTLLGARLSHVLKVWSLLSHLNQLRHNKNINNVTNLGPVQLKVHFFVFLHNQNNIKFE